MSLKSVLISFIVAGVLAGLVLISRGLTGQQNGADRPGSRTIGIDPVSVVEIRVEGNTVGTHSAYREPDKVDSWVVRLGDEHSSEWDANEARVRTVLRALGSASITLTDEEPIGDLYGTLSLIENDNMTTEVRFGTDVSGGFVRAEIVLRGVDGIATSRWFGRIDRSLRYSFLDEGFSSWRSLDLFGMTLNQVTGARVSAGGSTTGLSRGAYGWSVSHPWTVPADRGIVQELLGLTLGLRAERIYDEALYTDDLTGLDSPIARIEISSAPMSGADPETTRAVIEIGSAVDNTGEEVFARYTARGRDAAVIALKTKGLNRLTASPLAYVHQTASELNRADIQSIRILGVDGTERIAFESSSGSWENTNGAVSKSQESALDRMIETLTKERAVRIYQTSDQAESETTQIGSIHLIEDDNTETAFMVSIESASGSVRLHLSQTFGDTHEIVWVLGSAEAGGTGAWIAALAAEDLSDQ